MVRQISACGMILAGIVLATLLFRHPLPDAYHTLVAALVLGLGIATSSVAAFTRRLAVRPGVRLVAFAVALVLAGGLAFVAFQLLNQASSGPAQPTGEGRRLRNTFLEWATSLAWLSVTTAHFGTTLLLLPAAARTPRQAGIPRAPHPEPPRPDAPRDPDVPASAPQAPQPPALPP